MFLAVLREQDSKVARANVDPLGVRIQEVEPRPILLRHQQHVRVILGAPVGHGLLCEVVFNRIKLCKRVEKTLIVFDLVNLQWLRRLSLDLRVQGVLLIRDHHVGLVLSIIVVEFLRHSYNLNISY